MPKTRVLRPVSDCTDELSFVPFDYPAAVSSSGTITPHPSPELHSETPVFSFTPPPPRATPRQPPLVHRRSLAGGARRSGVRRACLLGVSGVRSYDSTTTSEICIRRSKVHAPHPPFSDLRSSGVHTRRGGGPCLVACMRACVLFMFDLKAGVWAGVVVFR